MKNARRFASLAIIIATIVLLFVISPLKGLGPATFPMIILSVVLWITALILTLRTSDPSADSLAYKGYKKITVLLLLLFLPLSWGYIKISGHLRTQISISIENQSSNSLADVLVYGTGDIFTGTDTLQLSWLEVGNQFKHKINPRTKPHLEGVIKIDYSIDGKRYSKIISDRYSINPYHIPQKLDVHIDDAFLINATFIGLLNN